MTDLPILYSFRRCPYAMRARLALLLGARTCEIREVVLRDKPAEMIAVSPKATVPVMVLPDGNVVDESLEIMRWALSPRHPGESRDPGTAIAMGLDPGLRRDDEEDSLIANNDGPFKRHLDRYKYPDRHDGDALDDRAAALTILADYEARLERHTYLCGASPSIADIAIMPFVRQFAAVDQAWFDLQPLPMLQRWLAAYTTSDLFERAMIRLPAWRAGDPVTLFPAP